MSHSIETWLSIMRRAGIGDAQYIAVVTALRLAFAGQPAPAVDAATAVPRLRDFGGLGASRTDTQRAQMRRQFERKVMDWWATLDSNQ